MTEETKAPDQKLADEYYARQRELDGGKPAAADWLDLAQRAQDAGLPKEAVLHVLKAGELDPENQSILEKLRSALKPDEFSAWVEKHTPEKPYWKDMKAVLLYPASREALLMLGMAALFLTAKQILDGLLEFTPGLKTILSVPVFAVSGILGIAMLAMLPSFFISVTRRAADGKPGVPDWPGFYDLFALAGAALKLFAVTAWSFLPLLLYLLSLDKGKTAPSAPLAAVLFVIASFYLPMALLLLIMSDKLWPCLLPSNVIDPVVRTFRSYWRLWLMMLACGLFLPVSALLVRIPVIGPAIAVFCGLYLYACIMHALGRFYRLERKKLNWT